LGLLPYMAANVGWLNYEQQRSTGPRTFSVLAEFLNQNSQMYIHRRIRIHARGITKNMLPLQR
ncbi:hypothetical protein B7943_10525, partial [Vibrio cholerae]